MSRFPLMRGDSGLQPPTSDRKLPDQHDPQDDEQPMASNILMGEYGDFESYFSQGKENGIFHSSRGGKKVPCKQRSCYSSPGQP